MPSAAIDAHVHLHRPASALDDLDQAWRNMAGLRRAGHVPVLMLAEPSGSEVFTGLADHLSPCAEPDALWYEADGARMLIVAGRQIISEEGLEILALAYRGPVDDGRPASTIVAELSARDAVVVLPWGAGKWLGERGRLIGRLRRQGRTLLLGDNGGRPAWWLAPLLAGTRTLSGSDPLPLPGSARRIGSFGTVVEASLSLDHPVRDLKAAVRNPATALRRFGRPASSVRFASDQLLLRLAR
jgi:hypothetical protein